MVLFESGLNSLRVKRVSRLDLPVGRKERVSRAHSSRRAERTRSSVADEDDLVQKVVITLSHGDWCGTGVGSNGGGGEVWMLSASPAWMLCGLPGWPDCPAPQADLTTL